MSYEIMLNETTSLLVVATEQEAIDFIAEKNVTGPFGEFGTFTLSYSECSAKYAALQEKEEALAYLAATDWYVIRNSETQVAVPQEVLTLRAAARLKA